MGHLDARRLSDAARLIEELPAGNRSKFTCRLKELRQDLTATKVCEAALTAHPNDGFIVLSLARSLSRDHRAREAEDLLEKFYQRGRADTAFILSLIHI